MTDNTKDYKVLIGYDPDTEANTCEGFPSSKFNVGDLVKLKSGSPNMSISGMIVNHYGQIEYQCYWYHKDIFNHEMFVESVLVSAD